MTNSDDFWLTSLVEWGFIALIVFAVLVSAVGVVIAVYEGWQSGTKGKGAWPWS